MVQLTIVVRPKQAYAKAKKIREITVDSSMRVETIMQQLKLEKKGTLLFSHGAELPLNSSLASHNIQDGDVLESCPCPELSAILSAVLQDLNAIDKLPEEERTEARITPLLDGVILDPWPDRWGRDEIKNRLICLATMKKVIQRQDRYEHQHVPRCDDLMSLYNFMQAIWLPGNGRSPRHHNTMAHAFKPSARNRDGKPTICWEMLQNKLNKLHRIESTMGKGPSVIEHFVKDDTSRHQSTTATPQSARGRRTGVAGQAGDTTPRPRRRLVIAPNSAANRAPPECPMCSAPTTSVCMVPQCPFYEHLTCSTCFQANHPILVRNHDAVPLTDPRAKLLIRELRRRKYCPEYASGPFAIICTLHEASIGAYGQREYSLAESRLKKLAQRRCRSNLYDHQAKGRNAFACVESLADKELIRKELIPGTQEGKFSLLPSGEAMGKICLAYEQAVVSSLESPDQRDQRQQYLATGLSSNIKLVIDTREDSSYAERLVERSNDCGLSTDLRELPAGDYLFTTMDGDNERVFPLAIERKSWCDLADSVSGRGSRRLDCVHVDGNGQCRRGGCQLCKMKRSGVSAVMFIIEGARCLNRDNEDKCGARLCKYCQELSDRHGRDLLHEPLERVLYNLQAQHGCLIHFTRGYNETIDTLFNIAAILGHSLGRERDRMEEHSERGRTVSMSLGTGRGVANNPVRQLSELTYAQFCSSARRAANGLDRTMITNGACVRRTADEFVDKISGLKISGPEISKSTEQVPDKRNTPANTSQEIILLDSDDEEENGAGSQESILVLDDAGWTSVKPTKKRSRPIHTASANEVEIIESPRRKQSRTGQTTVTTHQRTPVANESPSSNRGVPLILVHGMYEYDSEYHDDLNKAWKDLYGRISSSNAENVPDDLNKAATTHVEQVGLLHNSHAPLVPRESILFWMLFVQLQTQTRFHLTRLSTGLTLLERLWQNGRSTDIQMEQTNASPARIATQATPDNQTTTTNDSTTGPTTRTVTGSRTIISRDSTMRPAAARRSLDFSTATPPPTSNCLICQKSIVPRESITTPCSHVFHLQCLEIWCLGKDSRKCPKCNRPGIGMPKTDRAPEPNSCNATPRKLPPRTPSANSTRRAPSTDSRGGMPQQVGSAVSQIKVPPRTPLSASPRRRKSRQKGMAMNGEMHEARLRRFGGTETPRGQNDLHWTCIRCTLLNKTDDVVCFACGALPNGPESVVGGTSPPPSSRQGDARSTWKCDRCTLQNSMNLESCKACGAIGPLSVPAATPQAVRDMTPTSSAVTPNHVRSRAESGSSPKTGISRKVKCGACGQLGHNRASATPDNCSAYYRQSEVELRHQKQEKALEKARDARNEAARLQQHVQRSEVEQNARVRQIQESLAELQRENEENRRIAGNEARRQEKAAERAEKRARRLGNP